MNIVISTIAMFVSLGNYQGEPIQRQDINCMARAIYHESRGEPLMGQVAVGWVIKNRVGHKWYKESICNVVYQRSHFTDLYRSTPMIDESKFKIAVEVALLVTTGYADDPTNGAITYHNPKKVPNPKWDFKKLSYVTDIKNHRFYKEEK